MRWLPFLLVLSLCAALLGCQVEVYRGLTEAQVNTMLSTPVSYTHLTLPTT